MDRQRQDRPRKSLLLRGLNTRDELRISCFDAGGVSATSPSPSRRCARRKVSVANFGRDNFNFRFYRKLVSSVRWHGDIQKVRRRLCDEADLMPTNHFY